MGCGYARIDPLAEAEVLLREHEHVDEASGLEFGENPGGRIRRPIVEHDDLEIVIAREQQEAVADVVSRVVGDDDDRGLEGSAHAAPPDWVACSGWSSTTSAE